MSQILSFSERTHPKTLVLFDVDGTLTPARLVIPSFISRYSAANNFIGS